MLLSGNGVRMSKLCSLKFPWLRVFNLMMALFGIALMISSHIDDSSVEGVVGMSLFGIAWLLKDQMR